jgi:hypothetical protein
VRYLPLLCPGIAVRIRQHNVVLVKSNYFVKNWIEIRLAKPSLGRYYPNVAIPTAALQDTGATKKVRCDILLAKQLSVK